MRITPLYKEVSIDISNINKALKDGWVITFPQGTTKAWAPIRKGTAHIIKENRPIVVPIVIDGFRRSFDKKGLFIKKKNTQQKMEIKKPLEINYDDSIENITKQRFDKFGQLVTDENEVVAQKWVIQPKFETPMMNFGNSGVRPIRIMIIAHKISFRLQLICKNRSRN